MWNEIFNRDIKFLSGVGERRATLMASELGIVTFKDLLYNFPYRYIDKTKIYKIGELYRETGVYTQVKARIESVQVVGGESKNRLVVRVADDTGAAEMLWFAGISWVQQRLTIGREMVFFGKYTVFNNRVSFVHPEMDIPLVEEFNKKPLTYGIYSFTEKSSKAGVNTKFISSSVATLWGIVANYIEETLPQYIIKQFNLMPLKQALYNLHFPQSNELLAQAEYRIKFEELLALQLSILRMRSIRIGKKGGYIFEKVGDIFNEFYSSKLPFPLTGAQKRVVKEIRKDTVSGKQMNRLLQGDVGSGKTIVALLAMLLAVDNGFQACMMAPTEILANQHLVSLLEITEGLGIKIELLTGSTRKKKRRLIDEQLMSGEINILIGTHALIEDNVRFNNLGFVIIDEQHRFGVEQRSRLWSKSLTPPHILVMSATPIPRTLAMTIYGDLDVSIIDELPPGRKPIQTSHYFDNSRMAVFGFMRREIEKGRQVYVVYPLIKESEKMDYKNIEDGYESIVRAFPHPEFVTTIVHGKMKAEDKEYGMQMFKNGQAHIMVATSVIEVGVNVPNASVMVIESAERFGLSQLHQLRGRVGRGAEQSHCILMSSHKLSAVGKKRLKAMTETTDGFELAELDLKIRGYGDLEGTKQSGDVLDLKLARISKDTELLSLVREVALVILDKDPLLTAADNALLLKLCSTAKPDKDIDFSLIS
ncbi:MAG: ATP-dependent DNA helicase RecG [Rikenellaceae bacterium]